MQFVKKKEFCTNILEKKHKVCSNSAKNFLKKCVYFLALMQKYESRLKYTYMVMTVMNYTCRTQTMVFQKCVKRVDKALD